MKLNKAEFLLMNNPIRNLVQEHVEIKRLRKFSTLPPNKTVLEIGCGTGNGAKLIRQYFHPTKIYATDMDERMIAIAQKRIHDSAITFEIQNATKLTYKSNSFDAVFDLGVIHHIPDWKACLQELKRVLKPKGQLILEDLSIETFSTPFGRIGKKFLQHPYASMYRYNAFVGYLQETGFTIIANKKYSSLIQYFVIIAEKESAHSKGVLKSL